MQISILRIVFGLFWGVCRSVLGGNDMLGGLKTYGVAILMIFVTVLYAFGLIDKTVHDVLFSVLVGSGLAALRSGVKFEARRKRQ